MPNSFFRFKEFTIHQDRTAMKVCTDACIFGAWTASRMQDEKNILDIGTGTGLLALMLAQASQAKIDAVELDPDAAMQARENIDQTVWASRMHVTEHDIRMLVLENKYDLIITNPPFYAADLRSPDEQKNKAKHDHSLTLETLAEVIFRSLTPVGRFSILLPFRRKNYFDSLAAQHGFHLQESMEIFQTVHHAAFRYAGLFGLTETNETISNKLIIKDEKGRNTAAMKELMKNYYDPAFDRPNE